MNKEEFEKELSSCKKYLELLKVPSDSKLKTPEDIQKKKYLILETTTMIETLEFVIGKRTHLTMGRHLELFY